ncbi:MAG TPA: Lrp/AsnC ligand binding domain-containing protein [Candidatus Lokiarchaeia archaeon]|nr:Lrp/AsnC ligand binding domain-containing protein [Candidatus Lokiarchaeia archaeon]
MIKAFIMISLKPNAIAKSVEVIKKFTGVTRVLTITGEWDLMVEFEGETSEDLYQFHEQLDQLVGMIENTLTSVVMKEFEP